MFCYGRKAAQPDPFAPALARLWGSPTLPQAPAAANWRSNLVIPKQYGDAPDFGNLRKGDCTLAAHGHRQRIISSNMWGEDYRIPTDILLGIYDKLGNGLDDGLVQTTVLNYLTTTGFAVPERQLFYLLNGWFTLDPTSLNEFKLAVSWFMGFFAGLNLPKAAEVAFNMAEPWTIPEGQALVGEYAPGSGGSHELYFSAYRPGWFTCDSWGYPVDVSENFLLTYMEEAQAVYSRSLLNPQQVAFNGMDWAHLQNCVDLMRKASPA